MVFTKCYLPFSYLTDEEIDIQRGGGTQPSNSKKGGKSGSGLPLPEPPELTPRRSSIWGWKTNAKTIGPASDS